VAPVVAVKMVPELMVLRLNLALTMVILALVLVTMVLEVDHIMEVVGAVLALLEGPRMVEMGSNMIF
tara:strand:+ start:191 stop:391 length:201 start_codon:yes stop_codon:yes gene_type:complete